MNSSIDTVRRRNLAVFCSLALGALFTTNPLTHVFYRGLADPPAAIAMRGFASPLSMVLLVGVLSAICRLLRRDADRRAITGAALTIAGWTAGVRILGLGQLESLIASGTAGLPPDTLRKLFEAAPVVWVSIVPFGILFPIGMITLGLTMVAVRPVPRGIGALLATGAVLFPMGRIAHVGWALIWSDVLIGVALVAVGWQLLTRPGLWALERDVAEKEPAREAGPVPFAQRA